MSASMPISLGQVLWRILFDTSTVAAWWSTVVSCDQQVVGFAGPGCAGVQAKQFHGFSDGCTHSEKAAMPQNSASINPQKAVATIQGGMMWSLPYPTPYETPSFLAIQTLWALIPWPTKTQSHLIIMRKLIEKIYFFKLTNLFQFKAVSNLFPPLSTFYA